MSTIPCPGCGMPRAVDLVGDTPCPVCDAGMPVAADLEPEPSIKPTQTSTTFAADASTLELRRASGFPIGWVAVGLLVGFGIGAMAGVGGAFAWQHGFSFGSHDSNDTVSVEPPAKPNPEPTTPTATTPSSP